MDGSRRPGSLGTPLDLSEVTTYPLCTRRNLVTLADLADIGAPPPSWDHPELDELVARLAAVHRAGAPLLWSTGAHMIKSGLGPYLNALIDAGIVSHVAGNGAVAIHDVELAMIGQTSEDVADTIERGIFGMWEETGAHMHGALAACDGAARGFGAALGAYMDIHPELFPHREVSTLWHAFRAGIPFTVHVTIGADIIHQHPVCDFAAVGAASGTDFRIYCRTVSLLQGGALVNVGSAVTGPEVFLKALAIARNLGHRVERFTTANLDIVSLGDYRNAKVTAGIRPEYYYRPWKNIVVRPASMGGRGFHIEGRHQDSIPVLYHRVREALHS